MFSVEGNSPGRQAGTADVGHGAGQMTALMCCAGLLQHACVQTGGLQALVPCRQQSQCLHDILYITSLQGHQHCFVSLERHVSNIKACISLSPDVRCGSGHYNSRLTSTADRQKFCDSKYCAATAAVLQHYIGPCARSPAHTLWLTWAELPPSTDCTLGPADMTGHDCGLQNSSSVPNKTLMAL